MSRDKVKHHWPGLRTLRAVPRFMAKKEEEESALLWETGFMGRDGGLFDGDEFGVALA